MEDTTPISSPVVRVPRKHWSDNPDVAAAVKAKLTGRKRSPETCAKLSARVITPEWRAKLSAAQTGKKHTEASLQKLREANIGRIGPNLGCKFPDRYGVKNAHLVEYFAARSSNACRFWGFLLADGNIRQRSNTYSISIHIATVDKQMLDDYVADLGISARVRPANRNGREYVQVAFCDRALGEYLIENCGIVPRKSFVDPPFPDIPLKDLPHVAAGHFEGDGSVGIYGDTLYVRIVGSHQFMIGLSTALSGLLDIPYKEPKLQGSVYLIGWSKRAEVKKIYDCFYPAGEYIYMSRKRKIFEDFFASVSKYICSADHRSKLSESAKVRMRTDEARARTAAINKGKTFSPETRAKLSAHAKLRVHSEARRKQISESLRRTFHAKRCKLADQNGQAQLDLSS